MLKGIIINEKLKEWKNFYNYHRPHGSLNGKTPYEKLKEKLSHINVTSDLQTYMGNRPSPSTCGGF
ncbi:MAG: integrase core domain-containing protein [bacterium]|nr:integrase core domain-containing protein [bacterium]